MNRVETGGSVFTAALATVLKAVLITALAMLVLAVFVTYGSVPEQAQNGCITAATVLSVFLAGFWTARKRKGAGWLSGLLAGVIYAVIMILAGYLMFGTFSAGAGTLKMLAVSVLSGVVGGIIGVNVRFKRKKT